MTMIEPDYKFTKRFCDHRKRRTIPQTPKIHSNTQISQNPQIFPQVQPDQPTIDKLQTDKIQNPCSTVSTSPVFIPPVSVSDLTTFFSKFNSHCFPASQNSYLPSSQLSSFLPMTVTISVFALLKTLRYDTLATQMVEKTNTKYYLKIRIY